MKCLIIEDEEIFRLQLKGLLSRIDGVDLIGEAANCASGLKLIKKHPEADLLLLDVELPDGTGFNLAEHIAPSQKVIFITSHDSYALRAFEINALDYIQKPVTLDRLKSSLERLDRRPTEAEEEKNRHELHADDLILLTSNNSKYFTKVSDLVAIESDENYTNVLRSDGQRFVIKKTLTTWEKQLPANIFKRLGRQLLINTAAIDRLEVRNQKSSLWLKNIPAPIHIGQSAAKKLQELIKTI